MKWVSFRYVIPDKFCLDSALRGKYDKGNNIGDHHAR